MSDTNRRGRPGHFDAPDFTPELIEKIRAALTLRLLSYTEASRLYNVPRQTLYRLVRGELKCAKSDAPS